MGFTAKTARTCMWSFCRTRRIEQAGAKLGSQDSHDRIVDAGLANLAVFNKRNQHINKFTPLLRHHEEIHTGKNRLAYRFAVIRTQVVNAVPVRYHDTFKAELFFQQFRDQVMMTVTLVAVPGIE